MQGVVRVEDEELEVTLLHEYHRNDADLRDAVRQALTLSSLVPSTIGAKADDGWVTLTGTASSQFQRDEAEHVTARIRGVVGVTDDVELVPFGPSAQDVSEAIIKAMQRKARLDASDISVQSSSGTVTLSGTVSSWADRDEAIMATWNAPGVVNVVDDLQIT